MKQHIIFFSGITQMQAADVTNNLRKHTLPHGNEVIVIAFAGDVPRLLGVVVVDDEAVTSYPDEDRQFVGLEMLMRGGV